MRAFQTAVWSGEELVIWGGFDGTAGTNDGCRYNPKSKQWTPLPDDCPLAGRSRAMGGWTGESMIVWGGTRGVVPVTYGDGAIWVP